MSNLNNVIFKMDYNKYTKEELVTLCNTYKSKIDYLESLKNHVVLDNVSICDSCKFKGCHNLYDSPCDSLNECENTCGNYNER